MGAIATGFDVGYLGRWRGRLPSIYILRVINGLRRTLKRPLEVAKLKVYDDLYTRLDYKDGAKNICKLAKLRERKRRDFNQVKCVNVGIRGSK